jgi:chaperonin GroES
MDRIGHGTVLRGGTPHVAMVEARRPETDYTLIAPKAQSDGVKIYAFFSAQAVDSCLAHPHLRFAGTLRRRVPIVFVQPYRKVINMAFRPLHDRVVVRRIEADQKTAGGIIIPDSAQEKPSEGEIVAVGEGARDDGGARIALDVKAGDKVLFGKWSGTEVKIDGEDLLIMKESDIMGIIG